MKFKFYFLALLFTMVLSCNKSDDTTEPEPNTEDPKDKEPIAEDENKPVITVNGFSEIIETVTEISISIDDDSTVETKILHNGEELAVSSEKQFDVSINPYPIPVGLNDFIFISKDAKGNEISKTYSVEIKHLLMIYGYSNQESDNGWKRWLFFNNLEGKELAVVAPAVGEIKIYTEDIVLEDKIFYTFVNYQSQTIPNNSYKNLELFTYQVPLGMIRPMANYNSFEEYANTVNVTLSGIPFVNDKPDYYASGLDYRTRGYSGDDLQTNLTIKHNATSPIFIRTNQSGGSTPKFDGKKENFKYVVITPESGNSNITIQADQLIPAENNLKLNMPEHDPGTILLRRRGYKNAEDFAQSKWFDIYQKVSYNETHVIDYLDLPILPMLHHYLNLFAYSKNNHYYSTSASDKDLVVNMPDWPTTFQFSDTHITVNSNNSEIDYYSVNMNKSEKIDIHRNSISWEYIAFGEGGSGKSVPRLALPKLISDATEEDFYQTTNDLEANRLIAMDYAKYETYDEIVEWRIFNKNEPNGAENVYRQLSYPIFGN